MSERRVLHVDEILEAVMGPRGIDLARQIRAAQDVAPRAENPVPRSETPCTKKLRSCPSSAHPPLRRSRQRGPVGRPDEPLRLDLGRGIVGEHFFVPSRQAAVDVVEGLHRRRRPLLPRPEPQPRAVDGHGAARGIDEDAHARVARGIQDVLRALDVHLVGQVQQSGVALEEADICRGVENGDFGGHRTRS